MRNFLIVIFSTTLLFAAQNSYSTSSSWLMQISTTQGRFGAIEEQFRGFDTAMMEVRYRYDAIKKALEVKNYELANYHLGKIKVSIENGYTRRPSRKEASQNFFLNTTYEEFKKALELKNDTQIADKFDDLRNSCNACHADQKVGFITVE